MNPFLLFLLAILSPFVMAATLLVPAYAGICGASYLIYNIGHKVNPLAGKLGDVFYIINVYTNLFNQWSGHITQVSFWTYSLPLIILPLAGIVLSLWLTGKLSRKLKDIFQLGASV